MSDSVINDIVSTDPPPGHRIRFTRLGGTTSMELTALRAAADRVAVWLAGQGIGAGDRIGILASNSLEWVLLDLAALRLKVVTAGLEPGKFQPSRNLLARYRLAALFTDVPPGPGEEDPAIRQLAEIRPLVAAGEVALPDLPSVSYEPSDVTTLKFTSGSTGEPKGLAASVGSIDSSLRAVQEMFDHGPGDDIFVFLPLSLLQQRYWVYSALVFGHDVTISTYQAAFMSLREARPTVVMGVPAFFETAKRHVEDQATRQGSSVPDTARGVFGDRIRYLWTGSAPASPAVLDFFTAAGLPIYEGYGLNETCIVAKNCPSANRTGSVGRVLPGKQVLFNADGLISVRSDFPVATRYEYAPSGESERMFGEGGVVRTGDLGYLDSDGFLFIRGRADDVIVLGNGKKVVVRPVEELMRSSPAIADCVLFCPRQTHLVAVVSATAQPPDVAAIAERLRRANSELAADERIHRVVVAAEPFSIGNGLLTSQYKPRRQRIFDAYQAAILATEEGVHVQ